MSIPLNIAEGVGKPSPRDRARFHAIARGSALECAAIIDVLQLEDLVDAATEAKALLTRLAEMLTRMST
jgi:four helix bundle protein